MIIELKHETLDQLWELEKLSFSDPWSRDSWEAEFRSPYSYLWGWVEEGDRIDGFLVGWRFFEEFHIANLAVHPDRRGRGIAQALVSHALEWADRHQAEVAILEVRASNETALRLYLRNGFEPLSTRKNYYSDPVEDAIVLLKRMREPGVFQIPDSA